MGRKKKRGASTKWCFYCDREFEDEKILIQHQKAKHFKCHVCHKKLSTAAGMSTHVSQVHKETVSKVPNAIDGRDSTYLEIYGMHGIPADAIAAHFGEEVEDALSKISEVDVPSPQVVGAVVSGPIGVQYPLSMSHPFYNPAAPLAAGWPVPPRPQPWFAHHFATSAPPPGLLGLVQQPLFLVQNLQSPVPSNASPGIQPSFSNGPPGLHTSMPLVAVSQPLSPVVSNNGVLNYSSSFSAPPLSTSVPLNPSSEIRSSIPLPSSTNLSLSSSHQGISHSYASGPNTDGPSIGPPLMIANKAPQPAINEIYLIWEDEAMSIEERRMSLKKYQVHDETTQMSPVNAAIDRKISESGLASRMVI